MYGCLGVSIAKKLKDVQLPEVNLIYKSRSNCLDFEDFLLLAPNLKVFELPDVDTKVPTNSIFQYY